MLVVIILVRKLLDFIFTRKELKILDDIMPESTKRKREEEKELFKKEAEGDINSPGSGSGFVANSTSVNIPLANGNILKIPVAQAQENNQLNISEQLSMSDAWKSVNQSANGKSGGGSVAVTITKPTNGNNSSNGKKKRGNTKKDAKTEEEQKRLSIMREEDDEEDCGITIKVDGPTSNPSNVAGHTSSKDERNGETPV